MPGDRPSRRNTSSALARSSVGFGETQDPISEAARLFPVRKVAGVGDDIHARAGNLRAPGLAVGWADDAILLAPQQQRGDVDAMQPTLQMRVVHVWLPAESRKS